MNAITEFFATLFNAFRLKNPTLAGIIVLVLGAITATAMQGDVLGLFHLSGILKEVVTYVSLFLTAAISGGSATAKK